MNNLAQLIYLDCSAEVSSLREIPPSAMVWLAHEIDEKHWRIELNSEARAEIDSLVDYLEQNPLPLAQRKINDVKLPACRTLMEKMKAVLDHGVGFAVLDRLPIDDYDLEILVQIYWLLGQRIGTPVAQKWNGQMVYEVRDTGKSYAYGVRGSHTSVELLFHTDNAFARMVPDYVGLFCRKGAKSGGLSRFCSLYSVHQRMQQFYPELLPRLYQPMLFDRQKEHSENAPKVCLAPYFSWRQDRLFARANSTLVRQGYEIAEVQIDSRLSEALDAIDEVSAAQDLWYEAAIQPGQIQYLNNHEVGHYRSAFEDYDEPELKRHLFRLWHREAGSAAYDGIYLD